MRTHQDQIAAPAGLYVAYRTRAGVKAGENEDAVLVSPPPRAHLAAGLLCAVADGVGGLAHGAAASRAAVQTIAGAYFAGFRGDTAEALRHAVLAAHDAVRQAAADPQGGTAGATTIVAAVVSGPDLWVASAGDSRAYLFTPEGPLTQITRDHSWVQEQVRAGALTPEQATVHPWRRVITRCLGGEAAPEVDLFHLRLEPGCRVLLCSDGLTEVAGDQDLVAALATADPEAAVAALIALADRRGARDDATLCVVQVGTLPHPPSPSPLAERGWPQAGGEVTPRLSARLLLRLALLALSVAAALTGGAAWMATGQGIAPGVTAGRVPLGGLTTGAAAPAVVTGLAPAFTCPQAMRVGLREWVRTPAELGLWVNGAATAALAEQVGHQGSLEQQVRERVTAALLGVSVEPVIRVDRQVLEQEIAVIAADSRATPPMVRVDRAGALDVITARLLDRSCAPVALPVELGPDPGSGPVDGTS